MKKALMVVSFGTSVAEAETAILNVENTLREALSDHIFVRAFTSRMICRKLAAEGRPVLSPEEAFEKLAAEGAEQVIVQPTHLTPGEEFDKLCRIADQYRNRFQTLRIGRPLISDEQDLLKTAEIIWEKYGTDLKEDEALLLMGHGTAHIAGMIYGALQTAFRIEEREPLFVGTVEGWPGLKECILQLKKGGYKAVRLAPLMLVAGDHVRNDMAGDDEDSWKSRLEAEGFEVACRIEGMGSFASTASLYLEHVKKTLE